MIGAILGDIIGSPYEFDRGNKSKEFPLFSRESTYTDDTVMTLAVSLTFLDAQPSASDDWILQNLANRMRQFGKMYPNAGYGGMFRQWLRNPECKAYNSFGNGSAMRVSSVAWLYNDIDAVRHAARLSAESYVAGCIANELLKQEVTVRLELSEVRQGTYVAGRNRGNGRWKMYLAATRCASVLFGQIRYNEAPEIQVSFRR